MYATLRDFISVYFSILPETFIPIFVAIDVFGVLPIFLSMTHTLTAVRQKRVISESITVAVLVSLLFIGLGEGIFRMIGITSNDFKIAGGLVLLIFAVLELIGTDHSHRKVPHTVGVVPIGVPLIAGPAVLTTLLVLVDHYGVIPTLLSLLLNFLIVWLVLKNGVYLVRLLGQAGIVAISKIIALLLAAIAIMMIRLGIESTIQ
jgi:multiple antibiotic resistance protein